MDSEKLIEGYMIALDKMIEIADELEPKIDGLSVLGQELENIRSDVDRNKLLDMQMKIKVLKSRFSKLSKSVDAGVKWCRDAILLRLQEEELDNYKYKGKLFYPSKTPRYSVADRTVLDAFAKEHGVDIFGNTLNKEIVDKYLENNGELPPGISSYIQLTLNMRNS